MPDQVVSRLYGRQSFIIVFKTQHSYCLLLQINKSIHNIAYYFSKLPFNIIYLFTPRAPNWLLLSGFPAQICVFGLYWQFTQTYLSIVSRTENWNVAQRRHGVIRPHQVSQHADVKEAWQFRSFRWPFLGITELRTVSYVERCIFSFDPKSFIGHWLPSKLGFVCVNKYIYI